MSSNPALYCADFALEAGESLIGTAPRTDVWLMLEYTGAWESKAFSASTIPQAVKDHLAAAEKSIPNARIELIKQGASSARETVSFFVARSDSQHSVLFRFDLHNYEEILALDLAAVAASDEQYAANRTDETLFVVCTNGRRDRCCARYGLPIYQALSDISPDNVWECTHLGGHRLAANVAVLPAGLIYGRVAASDLPAILDVSQVRLHNLRGRSCFEPPVQAAEMFLREHTVSASNGDLSLSSLEEIETKKWRVQLELTRHLYSVVVEQSPAGFGTYGSCGDDHLSDVQVYRLAGIT